MEEQNKNLTYTLFLIFTVSIIFYKLNVAGVTLQAFADIFFIFITAGMLLTYIAILKAKEFKTFSISIIFPPYMIRFILNMKLSAAKKVIAILTMGSFIMLLLINILKIVLTPQM